MPSRSRLRPPSVDSRMRDDGLLEVTLDGEWSTASYRGFEAETIWEGVDPARPPRGIVLRAGGLGQWDTSLAVLLEEVEREAEARGLDMDLSELPDGLRRLTDLARAVPDKSDARRGHGDISILEKIGRFTLHGTDEVRAAIDFLGQVVLSAWQVLLGRAAFRWKDFEIFLQRAGIEALGISMLVSYLIGLILAFIGAMILQDYGASQFVADMVGIGMFRDMGALMTAIVMSGRSGAAYAAEIGSMVSTQELDALVTSRISPHEFLIIPRIAALVVMMPILTVFADFAGIVGGATVGLGLLDLSPTLYIDRTLDAVSSAHLLGGMLKGATYGALIGIAGCMRGIHSGASSLAVGAAATSAVVTSLILVITACGVFQVLQYIVQ